MQLDAAATIVRGLAQGVDVQTGRRMPPGAELTITHRNALAVAAEILEREVAAAGRRSEFPAKFGLPWTPEEIETVRRMYAEKKSHHDIAKEIGRTASSVKLRLEKLGLMKAD